MRGEIPTIPDLGHSFGRQDSLKCDTHTHTHAEAVEQMCVGKGEGQGGLDNLCGSTLTACPPCLLPS